MRPPPDPEDRSTHRILERVDERSCAALRAVHATLARCGVRRHLVDDEDCLQEIRVETWQALERDPALEIRSLDAWILGIARRVGVRLARRERALCRGGGVRLESLEDSHVEARRDSETEDPAMLVETADTAAAVRDALGELPVRERELLEAIHIRKEQRTSIARRRSLSTRRIRDLAARARGRLARRLETHLNPAEGNSITP